jgi:hypothetical protein
MPLPEGWPSLPEVKTANWDYLKAASEQWPKIADQWVSAFTEIHEASKRPGGTDWEGPAADAVQASTDKDVFTVRGPAEQLREAGPVAGRGFGQQTSIQRLILSAVDDAHRDGFNVAPDYTVTDTKTSYDSASERDARQQAAKVHEDFIKYHVSHLVSGEHDIGRSITKATQGLDGLSFPEDAPGRGAASVDDHHTFKDAPGGAGDMSSGDIDGIDHANRQLLQSMLDEYSRLPDSQVKRDRLADIAGIQDALKTPDSHLIYIAKPDNPADMIPAATAIGDPFKADHVSVTVPGVSGATRHSIATMTREAEGLRREAQDIARKVGDSQNVSTIAWVGYQPPPNIGSLDTPFDDLAKAGAPKLESFLQNLDTASRNAGHTTALFGHSYGSLVSGIALKDGASSVVDNAVLYGSPGFEGTSPAKLGMNDHNFFVMSAPDDPIRPIGSLAPLHGWGADPNDVIAGPGERYRFTHLDTDAGWVSLGGEELYKTGASGHSQYGQDPLQRMTGFNLATILLNRPDLAVRVGPYH